MTFSKASLEEVYRREYTQLVALAYALSGNRGAAEELTQEAFLAAHRGWDRVQHYEDLGGWLRRVVVNRSVSLVRRKVAEAKAIARLGNRRELPVVLPETDEGLWLAVRALPRKQAKCMVLHYGDDRSIAEIAAILDCAEGTVKAHLHQARQALAHRLEIELRPNQEEAAREQ